MAPNPPPTPTRQESLTRPLSSIRDPLRRFLTASVLYHRTLFYYLYSDGDFIGCPHFSKEEELQTKCHLYGLYLDLYLWSKPHYRAPTYRHDLLANLRNVAVPGTGVPLHVYCYHKVLAYLLIFILYPIYSLLGAINVARKGGGSTEGESGGGTINDSSSGSKGGGEKKEKEEGVAAGGGGAGWLEVMVSAYVEHLLAPEDWFVYWRLNSRVVGYHELMTHTPGYRQEDKWTFLVDGERIGVPVSPVLKVSSIVVKNKNEEGGLGIYFYKNALVGGDWIIQERLENSDFLTKLLPPNAPLSTLRVITASRGGLTPDDPRQGLSNDDKGFNQAPPDLIEALSCVFRAGRKGANTDHSSILFDVDVKTGAIREGSTNAHWYELGLDKVLTTSWRSTYLTTQHPDAANTNITGTVIEDMDDMLRLVRRAHYLMLPDVPFVGWDVALTTRGAFLLEVNLSCNFFRGSFDRAKYFGLVRDYLVMLQKRRKEGEGGGGGGMKKKSN